MSNPLFALPGNVQPMLTDNRSYAMSLGERGFSVFPLGPDGRPLRRGWTEFASNNSAAIYKMFTDALGGPSQDNIGILTGGDLLAVDVDVKVGPEAMESLNELKRIGLPSNTFTTRTPSNGFHLFFKVDPAFCYRNATKWRPGIDLRGHHGYVVAPFSERRNGTAYTIELDAPLADLPESIAALIREPHRTINDATAKVTADFEDDVSIGESIRLLETAVIQSRHDDMVKMAHKIFDLGVTPTTALCLFEEHRPEFIGHDEDLEYQLCNIADGREHDGKAWGSTHPRSRPSVYLTFERVEMTERARPRGDAGSFSLNAFSLAELEGQPIPPRPWFVPDLIPDHTVTLLSGDGGVGKSLVAIQLGVSSVAARPWLGMECAHGPALYASAEDDRDEIHRRADDIRKAEGLTFADLAALHVVPLAGLDAVMGAPNATGGISPTKLWGAFVNYARRLRPRLVVLDTLADVFGGDEVVRAQARQFVGQCRGLALELRCAVLLLSHPSISGMLSGEGTSGSTAWSNSVRGRLYLTRPDKGANIKDANVRVLKTMKINYAGGVGDERLLRWEAGRFRAEAPRVRIEHEDVDGLFLRLLDIYEAQGRALAAKPSVSYAPTFFSRLPDCEGAGVKMEDLRAAMERLFRGGKIKLQSYGPASKERQKIVRA